MKPESFDPFDPSEIERLYRETFADSEGAEEGEAIGRLVRKLLGSTAPGDMAGYVASDEGRPVGAILFTRLRFDSAVEAFLLSPVAICTDAQGQGIGQGLIRHGIEQLRRWGVELIVTYGDPGFYGRVGFEPVSASVVKPPFDLTQPEGWLAQRLDGEPVRALPGVARCVDAFDDPGYW